MKSATRKGWETFVGNSGVLQYFGSRDKMTAEYFSAPCGTKTAKTISGQIKQAIWGATEEPGSYGETGRPLFMSDELMVMKGDRQLLLVETNYPIVSKRVRWGRVANLVEIRKWCNLRVNMVSSDQAARSRGTVLVGRDSVCQPSTFRNRI